MLKSKYITDHNTFDDPNRVEPAAFDGARIVKGKLEVDLPAMSIVTLHLN